MKIAINKAKIIATFGPAIQDKKTLIDIIKSGADVIRFNFSHGDYAFHQAGIELVKTINEEFQLNIGILADLQGPKIRIGKVDGQISLKNGQKIEITDQDTVSTTEMLYISYDKLYKDVKKGERILINDGNVELKVISTLNKKIQAEVIYGGILSSNKGVNLPESNLSAPSLTPKDYQDLNFAIEKGFTYLFVYFRNNSVQLKFHFYSKLN